MSTYPAISALILGTYAAAAATMPEVDALVDKATSRLRSATDKRADVLREAADLCREALEVLEQVRGVSEKVRDKKATRIMAMIYWCRKMTPLDLSGRMISSAPPPPEPPSSGGGAEQSKQEPAVRAKGLDEIVYKRAERFERIHPERLQDVLSRYSAIAASFAGTKWGKKAARKADAVRSRVTAAREAAARRIKQHILKLEFERVLTDLAGEIEKETVPARKRQLVEIRTDVERLKKVWDRLKKVLESTGARITIRLSDVGHKKEGWVRGGGGDGVVVAAGSPDGNRSTMSWRDFGAVGAVRLAERVLSLREGESVEDVAVAATVAEDYVTARRLFEKLLLAAPERIDSAAAYFERAYTGYRKSAEGDATIRFAKAKRLVSEKKYGEAMREITTLQQKLSQDSALQEFLENVAGYRRSIKRRYLINDQGQPMSVFEKKAYKAFGGDAKLDERTGRIEIFYDFEDPKQLRDWMPVRRFGAPSSQVRWMVARGVVRCMRDRGMLMWKFPLLEFDIEVDMSYDNEKKEVRIYTCLNEKQPVNVWFRCQAGKARLYYLRGTRSRGYWYSQRSFIWRKREVAHVRMLHSRGEPYPFRITVNGKHGVSGIPRILKQEGCFAFSFDGGSGTVDNVSIKGKLDMKWFHQVTRGIK